MILMSLDKQAQVLATKWYINEYFKEELKRADEFERKEIIRHVRDNVDKKYLIERYFETHPKMKEQYKTKKHTMNKIKKSIGLGMLTVAIGTGAAYKLANNDINKQEIAIETEDVDYNENEPVMQEIEENNQENDKENNEKYIQFFDEISGMKNTEDRDKKIVDFTKERIVEAYNQKHEDEITTGQLQYLHLNEFVIAHKDKLGNDISYERVEVSKRDDVKTDETQELKQLNGGFYEFKVDGKIVAVYDGSGQEIEDKNIEEKQDFFKDTLGIIKEAKNLQDVYKYMSNDNEKKTAQNEYKEISNKLLDESLIKQADKQMER